jgi:CheY-like chemotaxis protein
MRYCDFERRLEAVAPGLSMTSSNAQGSPQAEVSDLEGMRILVVEDSWLLGVNLKSLLRALGAEVMGPVATAADADHLISELTPHAALVDFNLRGGELAHGLIDRLHDQGVRVVVISGYADVPLAPGKVAATLQKPIREEQLLAALHPTTKVGQ